MIVAAGEKVEGMMFGTETGAKIGAVDRRHRSKNQDDHALLMNEEQTRAHRRLTVWIHRLWWLLLLP